MDVFFVLVIVGVLLWACWHLFLSAWMESTGLIGAVKGAIDANHIPDEAYFEQASKEIRGGKIREGLWAKAWAEAEGDTTKAQASYIRQRVQAMKAEMAQRLHEASPNAAGPSREAVITCSRCGVGLRLPAGKRLNARCPECGNAFEVTT